MTIARITIEAPDYRIDFEDGPYTGAEVGSLSSLPSAIARLYGQGFARIARHGLTFAQIGA